MFFLAAAFVGWIGGDFVYRKVAVKNIYISLITIMFCFNEFAFTVQVKHKINSIQILGFIYIFSHKSQQLFKNLILGYDATASSNTPRSQIRTAVCWVTLSMHTPIPSHMYKHDVIHKSGRTAPWCVPSGWRTTVDGHSKFLSLTVFGILLPCDAVL